jgi:hypothetical protein
MWQAETTKVNSGRVLKVSISSCGLPLSYADVIEGWRDDESFRRYYASLLADAPFEAAFWEAPPVTRVTLNEPYEFVLVDSPQLRSVVAEPSAFAGYFDLAGPEENVVVFENLGGDAELVAPCPRGSMQPCAHLAAFVRGAPEAQLHELFRRLAQAIEARLSDNPLWVSTSGLGVYWLHVRLDSRPKYYTFEPYKHFSG